VEPLAIEEMAKTTKNLTLSVQKALRILSSFSIEKPELSLVEVARETGLSVSTTHRLLATLEAEGFVERTIENGSYRLAIKMFELGSIVLNRMELNIAGAPILAQLTTETEDTTYLSVLAGDSVLCVVRIEGARHLRSQFLAVGRHLPLHAGAASKVLLAYLPEGRVRQLLGRYPLAAYTDRTITNVEQFLSALQEVRAQGYAVSDEEITKGITAIAAPIMDPRGGVIAALSLAGVAGRYGVGNRPFLIDRVKEAASQISVRLGYIPALVL